MPRTKFDRPGSSALENSPEPSGFHAPASPVSVSGSAVSCSPDLRTSHIQRALVSMLVIGLTSFPKFAQAQGQTAAAYQAFSDTAALPEESAAREALDSLRYQLISEPELATAPTQPTPVATGGSQLSPALVEQMRAARERSVTQIQKMIDETDPVKNAEQRKHLEDALARTKDSYAQLLSGTPSAGTNATSGIPSSGSGTPELRIPAIGDRQPGLPETIANLKKMLRDNSPAAAITAFEQSEDYNDAARASANSAAAVMLKRPMAALAGLLRAHELEPAKPGHLINLAGLTASFEMPRHSLALLDAAEKLLSSARPNAADVGGLKGRAVLLTNRGRALVHVKRFDQAEVVLREAVRLEPNLSEARINLAHALYQQADVEKRKKQFRR